MLFELRGDLTQPCRAGETALSSLGRPRQPRSGSRLTRATDTGRWMAEGPGTTCSSGALPLTEGSKVHGLSMAQVWGAEC